MNGVSGVTKASSGLRLEAHLLLAGVVGFAMLVGGASRADVVARLILHPVGALLFVYALFRFASLAYASMPRVVAMTAASLVLMVLHVIPLPPQIWTGMPGRDLAVQVYAAAGQGLPWLPLAMVPGGAWNALFAMLLPVAALLIAGGVGHDARMMALRVVTVIGLISGLIGLLQILGSADGPLYFYRTTNNGSAVGLFANRNHQAMLLTFIFPLLALHLSASRGKKGPDRAQLVFALLAAAFMTPLILVTGSRNGLILAVIAIVLSLWVYDSRATSSNPRDPANLRAYLVVAGLALLAVLTVVFSRAVAVSRLTELDLSEDLRAQTLPTIVQITRDFLPWGSGFGSFDEVYRAYEPASLLSPYYLNHAHNDWIELAMTGGVPAVIILGIAVVMFGSAVVPLLRRSAVRDGERDILAAGRCGIVILTILAIGSIGEYPTRTPSLAVVGVLAIAVVAAARRCAVERKSLKQSIAGAG